MKNKSSSDIWWEYDAKYKWLDPIYVCGRILVICSMGNLDVFQKHFELVSKKLFLIGARHVEESKRRAFYNFF